MSHFISEQHHQFHWLIESGVVPFEALFSESPFHSEMSNIQCRLLGFDVDAETRQRMRQQDPDAWRRFSDGYSGPAEDEHLERAIALLQRIRFGIFEYFDYSCTQILRDFLSEHPPAHLKAPRLRFEPTEDQIEIMEAANAFDRKLYDAALPLFLERAAEHNIALGDDLIKLRAAPQPYEGLDVPELYRDGLLRWTNGAAHLRLAVPRSAAMVRLSLWNLDGILERRQQLRVTVDGREMIPVAKNSVQHDYEAHLPADRKRNFVSVRIDSETTSYPEHGRTLGVPVRSISISRMT